MDKVKLTEQEKALFQSLPRETEIPAAVEADTLSRLKSAGMINERKHYHWLGWAASIVLVAAGFFAGKYYQHINTMNMEINPTKGYMLILHEDPSFSPGDPQSMFEEYSAWMEKTQNNGVKITGQELDTKAISVSRNGATPIESEQRITGYFILEAPSLEEATAVAQANPHIKYGGTIDVKPFMVRE